MTEKIEVPRLAPQIAEQTPYPLEHLPPRWRSWIDAVAVRTAGKPTIAMISTACLLAINSLSSLLYDVQVVETQPPRPTSLYGLSMAESGARKSTVARDLFGPRERAENDLVKRWIEAKEDWADWDKMSPKDQSEQPEPLRPRALMPHTIHGDLTVEAMLGSLASRPALTIHSSDAAIWMHNWSMRSDQSMRSMQYMTTAWDGDTLGVDRVSDGGTRYRVTDARVSSYLMSQVQPGMRYIMRADAANGLSARTLVTREDGFRGETLSPTEADMIEAQRVMDDYDRMITDVSYVVDRGQEYEDTPAPTRIALGLTAEARALLDAYCQPLDEMSQMESEMGRVHTPGFIQRAREQVCRIAATLFAGRVFMEPSLDTRFCIDFAVAQERAAEYGGVLSPDVVIDLETLYAACEIGNWHRDEISRIESIGAQHELTELAQFTLARLYEPPDTVVDDDGYVLIRRLMTHYGRGPLRSNASMREQVVDLLVREGHIEIVEGRRGRVKLLVQ